MRYLSTNLLNLASHLEIRLHLPTNSAEEPEFESTAVGGLEGTLVTISLVEKSILCTQKYSFTAAFIDVWSLIV